MATSATRVRPNVLITGTPGTGKSTLAAQLAARVEFVHIEIAKEIEENAGIVDEWDEERQCAVLDEERLLDHIEDRLDSDAGGIIVDYHGCDFFPQRWFDLVVVLRCNNTTLFDRLKSRGYADSKVRENVECEIFGSLLEEAMEAYAEEIVMEMKNESKEDLEANIERIALFLQQWQEKK